MKKTKYFIMGFIFLLFLNSCGYLQYAYEQAVVVYGGIPSTYTDGNADSYRKDGPRAVYNPKYKKKVELLLQDIVNRNLTEKNIYYVDGKEIVLWLPEGVVMGKYTQTLKKLFKKEFEQFKVVFLYVMLFLLSSYKYLVMF